MLCGVHLSLSAAATGKTPQETLVLVKYFSRDCLNMQLLSH